MSPPSATLALPVELAAVTGAAAGLYIADIDLSPGLAHVAASG